LSATSALSRAQAEPEATSVFEKTETFAQWNADYYAPRAQRYYDRAIKRMLTCLAAQPGDLILDAGCGPGDHSIRVAKQGYRVHAIDISRTAITEAKRRAQREHLASNVTFDCADLTQLPFADASFESVFSWGVVIHIPQIERALTELVRILKPGGRLALYVTNHRAWDYRIVNATRRAARRPRASFTTGTLGSGCWYQLHEERLWVWRLDVHALTQYMATLGMHRTHRLAGSLTEIHCRLKGPIRDLLLRVNNVWYTTRLPVRPCVTNLLVFEKRQSARVR